ncbi:MAG: alpha-E domain-containing protein [Burkholderiales bacterium]|nr:alpha-E domain-containing protein [Burkholderiales bacterium]
MLSRVAESLYWMTRYLERAENTARLINATTHVLLDLPRGASFGWDVLLKVAGVDQLFGEHYREHDEANIMRFLISDERNPSSIVSCIRGARENSRTLREILPRVAWERINSIYLMFNSRSEQAIERSRRYSLLDELIERRQSVIGLLSDCMSHDVAFQFIKLGRYLERGDMTTRILDINAAVLVPRKQSAEDPELALLWMAVLESLNAYQMYRRHASVHVRGVEVVEFLLRDAHFPRTVRYCLDELEGCLSQLPNHAAPMTLLRIAERRLQGMRVDQLTPASRHKFLDAVQTDLARVHDEIAATYFHLHRPKQEQNQGVVAG